MLTKITLTNFKCFREATEFPLSLVNLLTGINGRGKSTLLQSLLLMRQSLEHNPKTEEVILNGSCIRLGTYNDIVNSKVGQTETIIIKNELSLQKIFEYELLPDEQDDMIAKISDIRKNISKSPTFKKIHYISADRIGPQDFYRRTSLSNFPNVGAKGENTINLLDKMRDDLVNDNLCLGEDAHTLITQTQEWLHYIFDGAKLEIPKGTKSVLEPLFNTSLSRDRFKASNIGFGYSYILPIVVSGLIAKKGEILIVENPEAHLHPKAQSRLIKFLVKVSQLGVQVFIESHSDHILNALRIAVLDQVISPQQANILYFPQEIGQLIVQIEIKENGRIEEWPDGFFDQMDKDFERLFGV